MRSFEVRPFLGEVSAIESSAAPKYAAKEAFNVRVEDGWCRPAYGYRNLQASPASWVAGWGLVHLHGFDANNAEAEEYTSFENVGAGVQAYARAGTDMGTRTAITGAGSLHASRWRGFTFRRWGYFFNRNHAQPVARHKIGDATDWVFLAQPTDPTTALTWEITRGDANSAYPQLSWAGLDPTSSGEMACTGFAANSHTQGATTYNSSLTTDNEIRVVVKNSTVWPQPFSIDIDLSDITAGDQDFSESDARAFTIRESPALTMDESQLVLTLTNGDGSPLAFTPTLIAQRSSTDPKLIRVWVFDGPKTRADWDNIAQYKLAGQIVAGSSSTANNWFQVSKVWLGGTFPGGEAERLPGDVGQFGYTHYYSSADMESGIGGIVDVPAGVLAGYNPLGGTNGGLPFPVPDPGGGGTTGGGVDAFGRLGVWVKFTGTASADTNVDQWRLYWRKPNDTWGRIMTQSDATMYYTLKMSRAELLALAEYLPRPFAFADVIGGFACRGWVTWLMKGGKVRHSAVGLPENLASDQDDIEDPEEGADFDLAFNFGDEGLGGGQVDEAVIVAGSKGVYAQTGPKPLELTPFQRLAGAAGACGQDAICRWRDGAGNQGLAYVDTHGEAVWFVRPYGPNPDQWPKALELTFPIRGAIRSFLIAGQSSLSIALSDLVLFHDEAGDQLWLIAGQRALILGRPDVATGKRTWRRRQFNLGGSSVKVSAVAPSVKRRIRWIRSDGKADEVEWNSSTSAWIGGANRDGGNAMPAPYWESQDFPGGWRRWYRARILRETLTDRPSLTFYSDRMTSSALQVASGERVVTCSPLQQGFKHRFVLTLEENSGGVSGIVVEESGPLSQRGK